MSAPHPHAALPAQERGTWVDGLMLGLAVFSIAMLLVEQTFVEWFLAHPRLHRLVILVDVAICGVFAAEFLLRLRGVEDRWGYAKSRWYEIVGMIPLSHPAFRAFRLFRILRIAVTGSRFVRATNRTFGEMAFEATIRRYQDVLVSAATDAIVLRSLDIIEPHLVRARLAEGIADAMAQRRYAIHVLVRRNMRRVPGTRALARMRWARETFDGVEEAAVDAAIETLRSEELNDVVQAATRRILDELRTQVRATAESEAGAEAATLPGASVSVPRALPPPRHAAV